MRSSVIVFPGSNCDRDIAVALEKMQFKNQMVWHKETSLPKTDLIVIPGGFSYGDYLRSGAIAGKSSIIDEVIKFAKNGCLILGICNGFQILTESHLLPGALLHNTSHKFICKNVHLKVTTKNTLVTNEFSNHVIKIPIAHGEGRYFADSKTLDSLVENDQILFKYSDEFGDISEKSNPNGSLLNIAGICNRERNVFGMMPHPERASDTELNNQDGRLLFESIIRGLN